MKRTLLLLVVTSALLGALQAQAPAEAPKAHACLTLNNQVVGPGLKVGDRPLPLLAGDPEHGFHMACSIPWRTLSPNNQPLEISDCFQNLLQVANEEACGKGTGRLWVNSRWVLTRAELREQQAAVCQQLETGAWAGTRDLKLKCLQRDKPASAADGASPPKPAPSSTAHPDPPHQ